MLLIEVLVVGAFGILPYTATVVFSRFQPSHAPRTLFSDASRTIHCLSIIVPLLWIMYRSGRSWQYFGIVRFRPAADLTIAILVAAMIHASHLLARWGLYELMQFVPSVDRVIYLIASDQSAGPSHKPPIGAPEWLMYALRMLANGVAEELVLRAYLLARIREFTGRTWVGILLVSGVAATYHLYQGSHATIVIFFGQIVLCWAYLKIGRIAASRWATGSTTSCSRCGNPAAGGRTLTTTAARRLGIAGPTRSGIGTDRSHPRCHAARHVHPRTPRWPCPPSRDCRRAADRPPRTRR